MKVGDYVEFAGNIFYATKDLTNDALNFNEFEVLAIYVKVLPDDYVVGKLSKINYVVGKLSKIIWAKDGDSPNVVTPIFITK